MCITKQIEEDIKAFTTPRHHPSSPNRTSLLSTAQNPWFVVKRKQWECIPWTKVPSERETRFRHDQLSTSAVQIQQQNHWLSACLDGGQLSVFPKPTRTRPSDQTNVIETIMLDIFCWRDFLCWFHPSTAAAAVAYRQNCHWGLIKLIAFVDDLPNTFEMFRASDWIPTTAHVQ